MKRKIKPYVFVGCLFMLFSCQKAHDEVAFLQFKAYDYKSDASARIQVMEDTLRRNNMSFDADFDGVRFEKSFPFSIAKY